MKIKYHYSHIVRFRNLSRGLLMPLLFVVTLFSCGESDSFTIKGEIEGNPTMNVRYIYYANGQLNRGVSASRDGKFEIKANSPEPTILEICDNDYRPMARLYVSNGDEFECQIKRDRPYELKVEGNDVSERWVKFLNDNNDELTQSASNANLTVERYVSQHPDDIVSTLLMLTSFDASHDALHADSLMSSINQQYRPAILIDGFNAMLQRLVDQAVSEPVMPVHYYNRRDSLTTFSPMYKDYSLIVISNESSPRADSIVPQLRLLSKSELRPKLQIIDLSMDLDTVRWHKSIASDSARWQQGWVAASIASPGINRLGIPSLPFYIVTDSTGVQLLRSPFIKPVTQFIENTLE